MNATAHASPRIPGAALGRNPLAPYLVLAALWLLTITLVPPRGNFPLNDDWIYAKIVQHLVDIGHYEANPYADPTFILQAYWGAAFVKVLGFSFETLRISTLVLGLVALWAAHWAAREAGLNPRWAFLVALTLLVNPLFLNLSYTFMTDVPFLALSLLSAAAYLRAVRTDRIRWIAIATTLSLGAYFVRQFAGVLLVAALPLFIPTFPITRPRHLLKQGLAIFVPLLLGVTLYLALPVGGLPMASGWDWTRLGDTRVDRIIEILRHFAIAFSYLALFAAPILIAGLPLLVHRRADSAKRATKDFPFATSRPPCHSEQSEESPPTLAGELIPTPSLRGGPPYADDEREAANGGGPTRQSKISIHPVLRIALLAALPVTILALIYPQWPHRLPNLGNLLYDFGVGPLLMPDMLESANIAAPVRLGAGAWWIVTTLAILAAAFLALLHLRASLGAFLIPAHGNPTRRAELFLALWSIGMLLVLTLPPVLARFDRYFVMAQVPTTILAARWLAARRAQPARLAFVTVLALFAIGFVCLQDYLAWNTARWKALAALQRDHGAPLEQINGGYEFNGWYHSDHFAEESRRTGRKVFGPLGWWTLGDDYRVSLRADKHFQVIGTQPYFSWLGWEEREILMLKRTSPDENFAGFNK